jgi:hypothetical protein
MGVAFSFPSPLTVKQVYPYTVLSADGNFNDIPVSDFNYGTLRIHGILRDGSAIVNQGAFIRFNNQAGNVYYYTLKRFADAVFSEAFGNITQQILLDVIADSMTAEWFTPFEVIVENYNSAVDWKPFLVRTFHRTSTVNGTGDVAEFMGGIFQSVDRISEIDIFATAAGGFKAGSAVAIEAYGKV